MSKDRSGVFRGCHVFDTHKAKVHLDENNQIIWIESDKIRDRIFWKQSWISVKGAIWNPVVFALENMVDGEKEQILKELNITYADRILKWLEEASKTAESTWEIEVPEVTVQTLQTEEMAA